MKHVRTMLLGAALIGGASTWAAAQAIVPIQFGWQHHDDDDRQAFREGYQQGRSDAAHRRSADYRATGRWREADDVRAYRNGYLQGYREVSAAWRGDGDRDGDGDHDRDDRGRGPIFFVNTARQFGMQDGFNAGLQDRRTGHGFRPTRGGNYKHADRGYDRRFGSKNDYKRAYREAYAQGYQNGYNGGPWQRR